ncbi:MAG: phenylalanine 4-monooxygenase, partial [Bacteroidetes bacterium]|nr:phenylalanine 4-monooxygenase [Bacteroidota bacterium]
MRYDMIDNLQQHYNDYTNEDFDVWKILYERQKPQLEKFAASEYLQGLDKINFTANEIPNIDKTNALLAKQTGWQLIVVPGIIKEPDFFNLLSQKKFPATTWLRKKEQLDYLPEPDMFHDVFGHAPLLSNQSYVNFFKGMSDIALKHIDNQDKIDLLGRLYWFTIEFGMIRENGQLKIYGAGIISSKGETLHCLSEKTTHLPFDVQTIMNTPYRTDILQEKYFVIDSFEQLYDSLPEIEA